MPLAIIPVLEFLGIAGGIAIIAGGDKLGEEAGKGIAKNLVGIAIVGGVTYLALQAMKKNGAA